MCERCSWLALHDRDRGWAASPSPPTPSLLELHYYNNNLPTKDALHHLILIRLRHYTLETCSLLADYDTSNQSVV